MTYLQITRMVVGCFLYGIAVDIAVLCISMVGCKRINSGENCADDGCEGNIDSRMCLNIIPYTDDLDICDQLDILFVDSEGGSFEPEDCEFSPWTDDWPSLHIAVCSTPGPAVKWIDVTISQGVSKTSTQRITLAEHNYCGREIAYADVTLHEDGPPTFGETLYVSPCEGGGLNDGL